MLQYWRIIRESVFLVLVHLMVSSIKLLENILRKFRSVTDTIRITDFVLTASCFSVK